MQSIKQYINISIPNYEVRSVIHISKEDKISKYELMT